MAPEPDPRPSFFPAGDPAATTTTSPGKSAGAPPAGKPRKAGRPTKRESTVTNIEAQLTDAFAGIGLVLLATSPADGLVIMERGPALAAALAKWAAENDAVRVWIERALNVSTVGAVLTAFASIAIPIAANHGLVPPAAAAVFGGNVEVPDDIAGLFTRPAPPEAA